MTTCFAVSLINSATCHVTPKTVNAVMDNWLENYAQTLIQLARLRMANGIIFISVSMMGRSELVNWIDKIY